MSETYEPNDCNGPATPSDEDEKWASVLTEKALDFVGIVNEDNTFRYVNPASERVLGYRPEELVGTVVSDLLHPDDLYRAMVALADALSTSGPYGPLVFRYRHKDGSYRYLELMVNILKDDPEVRGIVVLSRDVTGRLRIEPTTSESEEFFRFLVESAPDMVLVADTEGVARYASRSTERVLGYRPGDVVGNELAALLHPDDSGWYVRLRDECAAGPGTPVPFLARYWHRDGSWRWIEGSISNLLDVPGVGGIVHSGRDVTGRKEAEEEIRRRNEALKKRLALCTEQLEAALTEAEDSGNMLRDSLDRMRESEELFRTTFELAAVGMAHVSLEGRWLRVNRRLCEITGYAEESLVRLPVADITHPDDFDAELEGMERALAGEAETFSVEKRYLRKDRSRVWVEQTYSLVRDASGEPKYFISLVEDITERKKDQLVLESLTLQETEVLRHLASGKTNREIARSLSYSESYVKLLLQEAEHKLDVSNRTQAAARAVELGLVRRRSESSGIR